MRIRGWGPGGLCLINPSQAEGLPPIASVNVFDSDDAMQTLTSKNRFAQGSVTFFSKPRFEIAG